MRRIVPWLIALTLPGAVWAQTGKRLPGTPAENVPGAWGESVPEAPAKDVPGSPRSERPSPPPPDALAAPGGAGYVLDAVTGCWLWSRVVPAGTTVRWTGPCPGGPATGQGEAEWRVPRDGREMVVRYVGSLVAGRMHGTGTYHFADGSRYEGGFRDHMQQGHGAYAWRDGRRYEGNILNGAPSGRGVGSLPGGERYEGDWLNGRPHGQGVYRDAAGATTGMAWREGCALIGGRAVGFFRPVQQCQVLLRAPVERPV